MNGIYVSYKEEISLIKNLFKRETPLHLQSHTIRENGTYLQNFSMYMYHTVLIKDSPATYIENSRYVYDKVDPFLHHLASKYITEKHERYDMYTGSLFDIGIVFGSGKYDLFYKTLIEVSFEPENTINGFVFRFKEPDFRDFNPCGIHTLKIRIYAYGWYHWFEVEDHHESEDEEDNPVTIKAYKEGKCVVCLSNDPEILFCNCGHLCICQECEKRKPSKKCPLCRTRIFTKIII